MISKKIIRAIESSSWIRKMFEEAEDLKKEKEIFDFSLGNPDIEPPDKLKEIIVQVIKKPGIHRYMSNAGFYETRKAVASYLKEERGHRFSADDIIMTVGAGGGLNVVFKTILDPGEEVIFPKPYFVEYEYYVSNHGGIAKKVKTKEDFSLDIEAIDAAITSNTKAVLINSPNNPTGRVYREKEIKELAELLNYYSKKFGKPIYLVSDEPYRKITYGVSVPDVFRYYKESILVTSFSKDLSIPGERIGYIAVHPDIYEKDLLISGLVLSNRILGYVNAPSLMQVIIPYLLREKSPVIRYRKRRDMLCSALESFGYELIWPDGAFYVFPKSPIEDDRRFVSILKEENIIVVPGSGFGTSGYFRIAFCISEDKIERSLLGFKNAIKKAKGA